MYLDKIEKMPKDAKELMDEEDVKYVQSICDKNFFAEDLGISFSSSYIASGGVYWSHTNSNLLLIFNIMDSNE